MISTKKKGGSRVGELCRLPCPQLELQVSNTPVPITSCWRARLETLILFTWRCYWLALSHLPSCPTPRLASMFRAVSESSCCLWITNTSCHTRASASSAHVVAHLRIGSAPSQSRASLCLVWRNRLTCLSLIPQRSAPHRVQAPRSCARTTSETVPWRRPCRKWSGPRNRVVPWCGFVCSCPARLSPSLLQMLWISVLHTRTLREYSLPRRLAKREGRSRCHRWMQR